MWRRSRASNFQRFIVVIVKTQHSHTSQPLLVGVCISSYKEAFSKLEKKGAAKVSKTRTERTIHSFSAGGVEQNRISLLNVNVMSWMGTRFILKGWVSSCITPEITPI